MSNVNIHQLINQLTRLNVDKVDYKYLVTMFWEVIKQVRIYVSPTRSTDLYFRAVVWNNGKPKKIDSFKAPPAEFVKGFQRCNPPYTPMFYSASKRITALLECDVKVGDTVYLSQWINKKPVPINRILFPHYNSELTLQRSHKEIALYTYINTIFVQPVHETFSNAYKITAAITEVLTTGFNTPDQHPDIRTDGTIGLIYPSVVDIEDSYNVVFWANFSEQILNLTHVMELVVKKREGKKITIEVTDNAIEFPNGNIAWLGDRFAIPKLRESLNHLEFICNGRGFIVPVRDTFHTSEEIEDLLNENANKDWL